VPKFDGLFTITTTGKAHSTVTLEILGAASNKCRVFHTSQVKPYVDLLLDKNLEGGGGAVKTAEKCVVGNSKPLMTQTGPEHIIKRILQHQRKGCGYKFLVKWRDFPDSEEHNEWMTGTRLQSTVALVKYLRTVSL